MSYAKDEESLVSTLVERTKKGDERAFEQLFHLYSLPIYLYLLRMVVDDETARDLVQESFIKAWNRLDTLRENSRFKHWLYHIARNLAFNYLRRSKCVSWLSLDRHFPEDMQAVNAESFEESTLLKMALAEVRPKYRECLILQELEGWSQQEVAEFIGISKNSVSNYVARAYQELRPAYQRLCKARQFLQEREYSL